MAEKIVLNAAIDHSKGSIVSKTLIDKKTGTITLFAFDMGEGLSEHSSPFEALVQLLDGKAEIIIGGTSYHLQEGENIILPANIPHALKANEKFKMMLTMPSKILRALPLPA